MNSLLLLEAEKKHCTRTKHSICF